MQSTNEAALTCVQPIPPFEWSETRHSNQVWIRHTFESDTKTENQRKLTFYDSNKHNRVLCSVFSSAIAVATVAKVKRKEKQTVKHSQTRTEPNVSQCDKQCHNCAVVQSLRTLHDLGRKHRRHYASHTALESTEDKYGGTMVDTVNE